jgi:hypothetical protein
MMNYRNLLNELNKKLNTIFSDEIFANKFKDKDFVEIIGDELNLAHYLEKNADASKEDIDASKKYVASYKSLCDANFMINDALEYKKETDVIDIINTLTIYCKNVFNFDLELNKKINDVSNKTKAIAIPSALDAYTADDSAGSDELNLLIQSSAANIKLNNDIRIGNIYLYDKKPKIIPILKMVYVAFMFIFALTCFVLTVTAFV